MSLSRSIVLALSLTAAACGGTTPSNDASADISTQQDTGTMMGNDSGSMSDASMATDSSSGGVCGQATIDCMCMCGQGPNAGTCQNQCISAVPACGQCTTQAQATCCPAEAQAFAQCAMAAQMASDAGPACTTPACIQQRCSAEGTAFQNCFATAQTSNMACMTALNGCFGGPLRCPMM